MNPKSAASLQKYLPWKSLVREANQPKPRISSKTIENFEQKRQAVNARRQKLLEDYLAHQKNIEEKIDEFFRKIDKAEKLEDDDPFRLMRYWQNSIFAERIIEQGLNTETPLDFDSFLLWLKDIHKVSCSGFNGDNHYKYQSNRAVGKSDKAYMLSKIRLGYHSPQEGLFSRYKNFQQSEQVYLKRIHELYVQTVKNLAQAEKRDETLKNLSDFYAQASANPPFEHINNSLFMNIVNTVLKKMKLSRISHGSLDLYFGNQYEKIVLLSPENLNYFFNSEFFPALELRGANSWHWFDLFKIS